jgi:hypothetical protein
VPEDSLRVGQVPEEVGVAFERYGAFKGRERIAVVASGLIGMADRVVGIETGRVLRQGAQTHREPFVVVSGLFQKEAEHRLKLGLAGVGLETPAREVDAVPIAPLGNAIQADDSHGDAIGRILGGDLPQQNIRLGLVTALHGVDSAHVQPLALVVHIVGQRGGLTTRSRGQVGSSHTPGDIRLRAVHEREVRITLRGGIQGFQRPGAPAQKQVDAAFVRRQCIG